MTTTGTRRANSEPGWLRYLLLTLALGFLFFFLALPLLATPAVREY